MKAMLVVLFVVGCRQDAAPAPPVELHEYAYWNHDRVEGGVNPVVLDTPHGQMRIVFTHDVSPGATLDDFHGSSTPLAVLPGANHGEAAMSGEAIVVALAFHDPKGNALEIEARRLTWTGAQYATSETYAGGTPIPAWLPPHIAKLANLEPFAYEPPPDRPSDPASWKQKLDAMLGTVSACACDDHECTAPVDSQLADLRVDADVHGHVLTRAERTIIDEITARVGGC